MQSEHTPLRDCSPDVPEDSGEGTGTPLQKGRERLATGISARRGTSVPNHARQEVAPGFHRPLRASRTPSRRTSKRELCSQPL